jgi:hypothetical protein
MARLKFRLSFVEQPVAFASGGGRSVQAFVGDIGRTLRTDPTVGTPGRPILETRKQVVARFEFLMPNIEGSLLGTQTDFLTEIGGPFSSSPAEAGRAGAASGPQRP